MLTVKELAPLLAMSPKTLYARHTTGTQVWFFDPLRSLPDCRMAAVAIGLTPHDRVDALLDFYPTGGAQVTHYSSSQNR
jgi:hypothetical protein